MISKAYIKVLAENHCKEVLGMEQYLSQDLETAREAIESDFTAGFNACLNLQEEIEQSEYKCKD